MKGKTEVAKEIAKKHGSRDLIVILGGGGVVKNQEAAIVHNKTDEAFSEELMNYLHSVASKREIKNPFKEEGGCQLSSRDPSFNNTHSLISGKEALKALADGKEVEYYGITNNWFSLNDEISSWKVSEVLNSFDFADEVAYKFRLKPRTISINGIELPAPFEPNVGEKYWYITTEYERGYDYLERGTGIHDSRLAQFGAWETEYEIKQVVEALRSIFK